MNPSKLNSCLLCSGNRKLVLAVAIVVSIAGVAQCAEVYFEHRRQRINAEGLHSQVDALEQMVAEHQPTLDSLHESIERLKQMTVRVDQTKGFRDQVVEKVRTAGCQLRNLTFDHGEIRPWKAGDDPTSDAARIDRFSSTVTDYQLHTQRLTLVSSGQFENVKNLLAAIQGVGRFLHTQALDIKVDSTGPELTVVWELTVFDLTHSPAGEK